MRVVALVDDLLDRSRLAAAIPDVSFGAEVAGADVVVVDLARYAPRVAGLRAAAPGALIVGYYPHVAPVAAPAADLAVPRSRFFRDPLSLIAGIAGRPPGPPP